MRAVATVSAALGAAGLVALTPVAAQAAVGSGTVSLTASAAFISQLAHSGVALVPQNAASVTYNSDGSVTVVYNATGGDANIKNTAGTISYSGAVLGFSVNRGGIHYTNISSLIFDLSGGVLYGENPTSGETALVDLAGQESGLVNGSAQTYSSTDLVIDPAGAALLDSALNTTAFSGGQDVGTFSTTWTVS
jgi:hypothetical protein